MFPGSERMPFTWIAGRMVGHGWAWLGSRGRVPGSIVSYREFLARRPPKSEFLIGYSSEKIDLSTDEIWPPFWLLMWVHGGIETKNDSFPTANATHLPRRKTTQNGVPPLSFTGIKCATFAQEGPGGSRKGGGLASRLRLFCHSSL